MRNFIEIIWLQLYMLLKQWQPVSPEVALHLLDCSFPDVRVRQFAVHCLEVGITDDKLQIYLLQFIQVGIITFHRVKFTRLS